MVYLSSSEPKEWWREKEKGDIPKTNTKNILKHMVINIKRKKSLKSFVIKSTITITGALDKESLVRMVGHSLRMNINIRLLNRAIQYETASYNNMNLIFHYSPTENHKANIIKNQKPIIKLCGIWRHRRLNKPPMEMLTGSSFPPPNASKESANVVSPLHAISRASL